MASRVDASGAIAQHMIFAMGWARYFGIDFGGMVNIVGRGQDMARGVSKPAILEFYFGNVDEVAAKEFKGPLIDLKSAQSRREIYPYLFSDDPKGRTLENADASWFDSVERLSKQIQSQSGSNVAFPSGTEPPKDQYSRILTKELLVDLSAGASCGVQKALSNHTFFQGGVDSRRRDVVRLVAHVRRGETFTRPKIKNIRYTEDDWYFKIIAGIQRAVGDSIAIESHAFMSCMTKEECETTSETVQKFADYGISLHVSKEYDHAATTDAISAWAHFIKADILITAISSFSYVPAILNRGCIVYQPFWHPPMPDWIVVDESIQDRGQRAGLKGQLDTTQLGDFFATRLSKCLPQVAGHYGRGNTAA
eukprot:CAMPEP_0172591176 /NCGR_PEP_ID=MMETSP1068-20121228/9837_1 /TAXON_ID=35684 /ORGANISM="Pseudopedinella elastica, Strain CCMP716" /LENGTH=364 /DNA_ID=CAMNT_0013387441 /DNA_START=135 /DNA_END=1229 /DNA_ORIENTATION=-